MLLKFQAVLATASVLILSAACAAQADVTISSDATANMSCAAGLCQPTASDAVLNIGDLQTLLVAGNVTVTTTGAGAEATNIDVKDAFSWSAASTLALEAYQSIAATQHISLTGTGGLTIVTNNGGSNGTLYFGPTGRVSFAKLSSTLTINGAPYTLVNSVQSLAGAVANNASGHYALADNYDASQDGTYSTTPITTYLEGSVEGLGNKFLNITVRTTRQLYASGLFLVVNSGSTVENLGIEGLRLKAGRYSNDSSPISAGLTLTNEGLLFNDHVIGQISVNTANNFDSSEVGGLVAYNYVGTVMNSYAAVEVNAPGAIVGGLVGIDNGYITQSFSTGSVYGNIVGGLVGEGPNAQENYFLIDNSYSTASVEGGRSDAGVGGFAGEFAYIAKSYSSGKVTGSGAGGFAGASSNDSDCYWDINTSGVNQATGDGNIAGVTGMTSKKLKKLLPPGFDPAIWAQDPKINKGFPYLIANPPPK